MDFIDREKYEDKPGVYRITNLVNGNFYIGKTKRFKDRYLSHLTKMKNPSQPGGSKLLSLAAKKYGVEHFKFEVVAVTPNEYVARDIEKHFLRPHIKPSYNIADDSQDGGNYHGIPVIQYSCSGELLRIFASLREAAEEVGCSPAAVGMAVSGLTRTGMGFVWKRYTDEPALIIDPVTPGSRKGEAWKTFWNKSEYVIREWSIVGELLNEFTDIKELLRSLKVSRDMFRHHLHGAYLTLKNKIYTVNDDEPGFSDSIRNWPVRKLDRVGNLLHTYQNAKLAAKTEGCSYSSIHDALTLHHGTNKAVGYYWVYDDGSEFKPVLTEKNCRQVIAFDDTGKTLGQYLSVQHFIRAYNTNTAMVYKNLLPSGTTKNKLGVGLRYLLENEPLI